MQLPEHLTSITPVALAHARETAGLTQERAARIVYLGAASRWAEYENGARNMDAARFELFLLLTDQHPRCRLRTRKGDQPASVIAQDAAEARQRAAELAVENRKLQKQIEAADKKIEAAGEKLQRHIAAAEKKSAAADKRIAAYRRRLAKP